MLRIEVGGAPQEIKHVALVMSATRMMHSRTLL